MDIQLIFIILCVVNVAFILTMVVFEMVTGKLERKIRRLRKIRDNHLAHMPIDEDWTLGRPRPSDGHKPKPQ